MSPHRALVTGAIVAIAFAAAVLVRTLRPDAGAAGDAARIAARAPVEPVGRGPVEDSPERGVPAFAVRFGPEDHGGHRQSWTVAQAPSGLIYVANSDGILEYDGADWRLIDIPDYRARALAVSADGVVHVGGEGTIGVLAPDSSGVLAYREVAGAGDLDGTTIWAAVPTGRGVLFQAFDRVLLVEGGRVVDIHHAPDGQRYHKAFDAAGAYVRLEGVGLLRYDEGRRRLEPVDGGEHLADRPTRALLDLDGRPGGALLGVTDDELFRIEPEAVETFVPIPSEVTGPLRRARAYHGCAVGASGEDGRALAITTTGGEVLVVRPDGRVVERIGAASGLSPDDLVLGCSSDVQGGLWLALSEAVARVDVGAPLTAFDARLGVDGAVYAVTRHRGEIYAATVRGVYRQRPSTAGRAATFEPVLADSALIGQAWALLPSDDGLLVAATAGIFVVEGSQARAVSSETAFSLKEAQSVGTETRVYAGLRDGLGVLRLDRNAGRWTLDRRIDGLEGDVRAVLPLESGGTWVAEPAGRLLRITEAGEVAAAYGAAEGVPEGLASVQVVDGHLAVLAADGPYRVVPGPSPRFEPMPALTRAVVDAVGDLAAGYGVITDHNGHAWITGRDGTRVLMPVGGAWTDVTPAVLRRRGGVKGIRTEPDVLWLATTAGLLRLGDDAGERYARGAVAHVRAVTAGADPEAVTGGPVTAPYGQPVRFRFAATAYHAPDRTLYRTQLVGHDAAPSAWSDERFRDYTNLPPGEYAFRVEALTGPGAEARPAAVTVHVPAPWYLSVWAAVLAAVLAGAAVAVIAWAVSRHHRLQAGRERRRADELDRLNAELRHADEVKDAMLANTSHELRTPLTALYGFSEILADHQDPEVSRLAAHMLSAGRRLLHTINDLLDIARLRSGKVVLSPVETDAADIARRIGDELTPLAVGKGLVLAVVPEGLAVPATLDPDAFARVLTNLVSNAVKFTEEGAVTITVGTLNGDVLLSVADTGRGMDAAFLPRLFDSFEQESTGYGRSAEGSGLGMAITARLVALMRGRIDVESAPGEGTTVRVRVPVDARAGSPVDRHRPPPSEEQPDGPGRCAEDDVAPLAETDAAPPYAGRAHTVALPTSTRGPTASTDACVRFASPPEPRRSPSAPLATSRERADLRGWAMGAMGWLWPTGGPPRPDAETPLVDHDRTPARQGPALGAPRAVEPATGTPTTSSGHARGTRRPLAPSGEG